MEPRREGGLFVEQSPAYCDVRAGVVRLDDDETVRLTDEAKAYGLTFLLQEAARRKRPEIYAKVANMNGPAFTRITPFEPKEKRTAPRAHQLVMVRLKARTVATPTVSLGRQAVKPTD